MFPNQWTKSCLAINTISGSIDWVIEGAEVLSTYADDVTNRTRIPKNLGRRLILGAMYNGNKWFAVSNKVTNLNIFSSSLSIENMKSLTRNGACIEEDMEWSEEDVE